ncbi:hypothetical protein FOPG_04114 [Fusarium oxysporum f. sp. conglutinans race 2 54008]|uniref:Uncharacterized protein n=2 Tax=Fusarium oxysporum TaxID=5507 RepID=X0IG32_FUSOX|nr:hypothetical protein FOVG_02365 [Fusarium oxysporum f. sp. pisi HDV247]EXL83101.1 hypothetical protein FOPG_04114 [Fusarium oxysporum f. sp. conglutinans race 2 54008]
MKTGQRYGLEEKEMTKPTEKTFINVSDNANGLIVSSQVKADLHIPRA